MGCCQEEVLEAAVIHTTALGHPVQTGQLYHPPLQIHSQRNAALTTTITIASAVSIQYASFCFSFKEFCSINLVKYEFYLKLLHNAEIFLKNFIFRKVIYCS